MAFLDDGLEALFEGVTGLQRRCDRDQEVRKLVLNAILWTAKAEVPAEGVQCQATAEELEANLDPKGEGKKKQ